MARIVESLTARPKLKPQADFRETDIYTRPATPALPSKPAETNNWMRLGAALKDFQPSLNGFLEAQGEKHRKEQMSQAEADAAKYDFETNRVAWGALVKEHPELLTRDPWYRRGLRMSFLRQRARDYDMDLRDAYTKSDVQNDDDPETYKKWQRDFRGQWIKDHIGDVEDTELVEAFVPGMEQAESTMGKHHTAVRDQALQEMGRTYLVDEIYKEAELEFRTLEGNDPAAHQARSTRLAGKIKSVLENFRGHHQNPTEANKLAVQAIAAIAVDRKDATILDILDHIETAPGQLLGKTALARQLREQAEDKIEDSLWERDNREWTTRRRREEEETAEVRGLAGQQMVQALLAKEEFNPLEFIAAEGRKGRSGRVLSSLQTGLIETWKAMKSVADDANFDKQEWANLRYRIFQNEDVAQEIILGVASGTLAPEWADQLYDNMQTARSFKIRFEDDIFDKGDSYLRRTLEVRGLDGEDMESKRLTQEATLRFRSDMAAKMEAYAEAHNGTPMPIDQMRAEAEKLFVHIGNMSQYHSTALREAMDTSPGRKAGEPPADVPPMQTPAEEKLRGTYRRSFSPVQVMEMDRSQVDATTDHLWATSDSFLKDVEAWETNPGSDSVVEKMALHLGYDSIPDFIRDQVRAWNPRADYRSPTEMAEDEAAMSKAREVAKDERLERTKEKLTEKREERKARADNARK